MPRASKRFGVAPTAAAARVHGAWGSSPPVMLRLQLTEPAATWGAITDAATTMHQLVC